MFVPLQGWLIRGGKKMRVASVYQCASRNGILFGCVSIQSRLKTVLGGSVLCAWI